MGKRRSLKGLARFFTRASGNPEGMARGVGIGLFVGFLPAIGLQLALAVVVARALNANALAAAIGTLVTNPLTTVPLSALSLWLGNFLLLAGGLSEFSVTEFSWRVLASDPWNIGVAFVTGCLALSTLSAAVGYGGMRLYFVSKHFDRSRGAVGKERI